jgi:hypothetical protein
VSRATTLINESAWFAGGPLQLPAFFQFSKGFGKVGVGHNLVALKAKGSKFMIKSLDKRFLPGVSVLIFLLIMALTGVTLSRESQAGKQNILRQASLEWMQMGMEQYQSKQFSDAEQSFRRALVFHKYLTDAERNQLNKYLANARIAISKGKQAVASPQTADKSVKQPQPVKAAAGRPAAEQKPQQVKKVPKTISSQTAQQKVQPLVAAKPSMSKIQLAAETPSSIVVVKNKSSVGKLQGLSAWLTENRREILMISLPLLAVLIIISKMQGKRKRPGRRVYENPALATSFIGVRLNDGNGNGDSKNGRSASAVAVNPKRKSFKQSMEHWRKNAIQSPAAGKPFEQKLCAKCNKMKDLSDFHKNKSSRDGLASWCKECKSEYRKKRTAGKN